MIAIDTNVLLRYLLSDDEEQATKASFLISDKEDVLITDIVLVETLGTLKGKKYQLNKSQLISVVQALFEEPNIWFENGQVVWLALNDYQNSIPVKGKDLDFADVLIVHKARYVVKSQGLVFNGCYTVDRAAQQLPGAKAP